VSFLHVKAGELKNLPTQGNQIISPKPTKTHDRTTWLLTAGIDSAGDNLSMKLDSQASQQNPAN